MSPAVEYLQGLWCEMLGHDHIEIDRTFTSLGGDSMTVIRMLVTVAARYGEIDFERFFENPTIATLSQLIQGAEVDTGT